MTSSTPRSSLRRRTITAALCLLIFVSGGIVGGSAVAAHLGEKVRADRHDPAGAPGRLAVRLKRMLQLTDEQTVRVERILRSKQDSLLQLQRAALQNANPKLDELETEVAGELSPEQAKRWRKHYKQLRSDWVATP